MPPTSPRRADVLAAVPTLFDDDGRLDVAANETLLAGLVDRVDGVFVAGTTGEFPALDRAERRQLLTIALRVFDSHRMVAHVGAASTREAVALTEDALELGASRIAAMTPYFLPVDEDAALRHFAAITAAAGDADVYGYLFAERSGVVLDPAQYARILVDSGLAGAKLSGTAADRMEEYLALLPPGTSVWSGADTTLAAVVRGGGAGVVSGLSSAFPEPFTALAEAVAAQDAQSERTAQSRVDDVLAALGGTVHGIKAALHQLGHGNGALRMPAPRLDQASLDHIARLVASTGDSHLLSTGRS